MQKRSEMQLGWEFAANIAMADVAAHAGAAYVDAVEKALAALKKTVDKNQSDLETQNKANIIIANQVQKSTERIQSLENYKTNSSKDIAALKASVDANIAFPWIGSEDEYLALINTEEFDPNKLYFTYEE